SGRRPVELRDSLGAAASKRKFFLPLACRGFAAGSAAGWVRMGFGFLHQCSNARKRRGGASRYCTKLAERGRRAGRPYRACLRRARTPYSSPLSSLDSDALRQIARLIDISATMHRNEIGEQLERNAHHDRCQKMRCFRNRQQAERNDARWIPFFVG